MKMIQKLIVSLILLVFVSSCNESANQEANVRGGTPKKEKLNLVFNEPDIPSKPNTPQEAKDYIDNIAKFPSVIGSKFARSYTLKGSDIYAFIKSEQVNTICCYNGIDGDGNQVFLVFPVLREGGKYSIKEASNTQCLIYPASTMCVNSCDFATEVTPPANSNSIPFDDGQAMTDAYYLRRNELDTVRGFLLQRSMLDDLILNPLTGKVKNHLRVYHTLGIQVGTESDTRGVIISPVDAKYYNNTSNSNFYILNHKSLCPHNCDVLKFVSQYENN